MTTDIGRLKSELLALSLQISRSLISFEIRLDIPWNSQDFDKLPVGLGLESSAFFLDKQCIRKQDDDLGFRSLVETRGYHCKSLRLVGEKFPAIGPNHHYAFHVRHIALLADLEMCRHHAVGLHPINAATGHLQYKES